MGSVLLNHRGRRYSLDIYGDIELRVKARDSWLRNYLNISGKGTIVKIEEDDRMPVDKDGNVADIVMDAASVISRMNLAKLYEHYISGAARDVGNRIKARLGVTKQVTLSYLESLDKATFDEVYGYLTSFYRTCTDKQADFFEGLGHEEKCEHLRSVINDRVLLYYPVRNNKKTKNVVKVIEEKFKPTYGPVTYIGNSGVKVTTEKNVRIAPMYIILLEKITDEWSAVSTGNLQHFGILTQITKSEKFALPYRNSPVRTIGETEGRIFVGYCGREAFAEMFDKSNNPTTQRNIIHNILNASIPTNIKEVVDRTFVPLGNNKPKQIIGHMFGCYGFRTHYEPEDLVPKIIHS